MKKVSANEKSTAFVQVHSNSRTKLSARALRPRVRVVIDDLLATSIWLIRPSVRWRAAS